LLIRQRDNRAAQLGEVKNDLHISTKKVPNAKCKFDILEKEGL
jgi:hypothetical protein